QVIQSIDLILQQKKISLAKMIQRFVHPFPGLTLIGSAVNKNAVLSASIQLNHSVSAASFHPAQAGSINSIFPAYLQKHLSVFSFQSALVHRYSGAGQRHRLIQTFSSAENISPDTALGLSGLVDVIYFIYIIVIQRSVI